MSQSQSNRRIVLWIVAGLIAWGAYLAIGDYVQNQNWRRSAVTIACVAVFLIIWLVAMATGRRGRESNGKSE